MCAAIDHQCRTCGAAWFSNRTDENCEMCGSDNIQDTFDEADDDWPCDVPDEADSDTEAA
jgi:predicted  nucleic acid-binding Zn-ribbon protein